MAGLQADLACRGLDVVDSGACAGPASTLAWYLGELTAFVLSFGIRPLRSALNLPLQALFSPIKWLDVGLSRMPGATDLALEPIR